MFAQDFNQFDANGKRHGVWKKNFEDSNIIRYEGQFSHGKEIGLFKFYKNYKKKAILSATKQFTEEDNKAQVKFLASSGKVISEGRMDGKIYIGTWEYYQKNSDKLLTLEHYNNQGELVGDRLVYYPNGRIAEKQYYINGKFYNPKGELVSEGQYKRGKKDGLWKYYEKGDLIKEKDFTYKPKYIKKTP